MKRGFSLIELIIAIAIASGLGLILFNALNQSTRTLKMVQSVAIADINVLSLYDRFEKDVTGAFIPVTGDPDLAERTFMKRLEKQQEQERAQQEAQSKGTKIDRKPEKSTSLKPVSLLDIQVKKVFVYEESESNMAIFSCITCNPFAVYRTAKPRLARVTYTLKHDPLDKNNYALWRRESIKLGFKAEKETREYVIVRHIKSLRLELLAPPQKDETKTNAPKGDELEPEQQQQEKLVIYKKWPIKEKQKKKDEKKPADKVPLVEKPDDLPRAVKMYVQYDDPIEHQIKKYDFVFDVLCYKAPSEYILGISLIHQQREEQKKKHAEQQRAAEQKQQQAQTLQPTTAPAVSVADKSKTASATQFNPLISIGPLTAGKVSQAGQTP